MIRDPLARAGALSNGRRRVRKRADSTGAGGGDTKGKGTAGYMKTLLKVVLIIISPVVIITALLLIDSESGLKRPVGIGSGSYSGRVVDAVTGEPVEDAVVYMIWECRRKLNPLEGMLDWESGYNYDHLGEAIVFTDADGNYRAPEESIRKWVQFRMSRPKLSALIYRKGYVAYRNDSYFDGERYRSIDKSRSPFKRSGNLVKLEPWKEEYSHRRHYDYIDNIMGQINHDTHHKLKEFYLWEADRKFRE